MLKQDRLNNQLIGNAGEYFVAGELSRRGVVAALTMAGTKAFDILAVNESKHKNFAIQVKTTKKRSEGWLLSEKDETVHSENLFYVFVWLPNDNDEKPEYYIVPAEVVAETVKTEHEAWLQAPGRGGKAHQPTNIRVFRLEHRDKRYYNCWDYFT